jgi:hypothetical protein
MEAPGCKGSYKLSHLTYIALYSDWETQLRYYPVFAHFKPTQLILHFVQGLLRKICPHIMHIENYLHWHQATHKFKEVEPVLPDAYDATELHEVLTAAVQSLDLAGRTPTQVVGQAIHNAVAAIDLSMTHNNDFVFEEEYLADFATFCDDDLATTDPSFDICISSAIQRFQNSHYQRNGNGGNNNQGGQPSGTPTPCLSAPCSRTHPPEQCCICRAVHSAYDSSFDDQ